MPWKHPSLGIWHLGNSGLVREDLKHIPLPPDPGPSKYKGFEPPCLASSQSLPQRRAKRSFRLYSIFSLTPLVQKARSSEEVIF